MEDLGQISEISFRLNVGKNDSRLKSMKRGFQGILTVGENGEENNYNVKIKSRYTMKDGTIQYRCIPLYNKQSL